MFGAIDPSSGTAVMKELSRSMGQLVKEGSSDQLMKFYILLMAFYGTAVRAVSFE